MDIQTGTHPESAKKIGQGLGSARKWPYRPQTETPAITPDVAERFWAKVGSADPGACWPWKAALDDKGYGMFKLNGRMWKAPRVCHLICKGDPGGLGVLHTCDNPACVNPAHLFLGTQKANMQDCASKGRLATQRGLAGFGVTMPASRLLQNSRKLASAP